MSEELIIKHCSPTLAGIKTGNIFNYYYKEKRDLIDELCRFNRKLIPKGMRAIPIGVWQKRALIYIYRPSKLQQDLTDNMAAEILKEYGYSWQNADRCVVELMHRIQEGRTFPHEIGLFLGYPPEDVKGFIEHKGKYYKCVGFWKVYGDEDKAQRCFEIYRKCIHTYYDQWKKGRTFEQLTVSAIHHN